LIITVAGAALIVMLQWLNLRRMGGRETALRRPFQALAERILPQSKAELIPSSPCRSPADCARKFLYRGICHGGTPVAWGLPVGVVILFSSVHFFGLAHLYQGRAGFVSTMVLGILFGVSRAAFGSLVPQWCGTWAWT